MPPRFRLCRPRLREPSRFHFFTENLSTTRLPARRRRRKRAASASVLRKRANDDSLAAVVEDPELFATFGVAMDGGAFDRTRDGWQLRRSGSVDAHSGRSDDPPHRPYSTARYLLLQRGGNAVAQSRMAGAGGAGRQLRASRRIRPPAPEAARREHHDWHWR